MINPNKRVALAVVLALSATFASVQTASSQEIVKGVLEACESDITKFCEGVTPGDGRVAACMYAYEDQITEECSIAIVDFGDAIDNLFYSARQALAICAADIETHCADAQIGGGRILSCLEEVSSEIADECRTVTAEFYEAFIAE